MRLPGSSRSSCRPGALRPDTSRLACCTGCMGWCKAAADMADGFDNCSHCSAHLAAAARPSSARPGLQHCCRVQLCPHLGVLCTGANTAADEGCAVLDGSGPEHGSQKALNWPGSDGNRVVSTSQALLRSFRSSSFGQQGLQLTHQPLCRRLPWSCACFLRAGQGHDLPQQPAGRSCPACCMPEGGRSPVDEAPTWGAAGYSA